jgi:hypothetical protein
MTFQYFLYLDINISVKKVFHAYYYKLSVPHAERIYGAAIIAAYCYDAVTVLLKCRNSNFFFRSVLPLRRQIKCFRDFINLIVFSIT